MKRVAQSVTSVADVRTRAADAQRADPAVDPVLRSGAGTSHRRRVTVSSS